MLMQSSWQPWLAWVADGNLFSRMPDRPSQTPGGRGGGGGKARPPSVTRADARTHTYTHTHNTRIPRVQPGQGPGADHVPVPECPGRAVVRAAMDEGGVVNSGGFGMFLGPRRPAGFVAGVVTMFAPETYTQPTLHPPSRQHRAGDSPRRRIVGEGESTSICLPL